MSAVSKKQQKLFGIVRSIQKGEMKKSEATANAVKMADTISPKEVKKFASTKTEDLPEKVKKEVGVEENWTVLERFYLVNEILGLSMQERKRLQLWHQQQLLKIKDARKKEGFDGKEEYRRVLELAKKYDKKMAAAKKRAKLNKKETVQEGFLFKDKIVFYIEELSNIDKGIKWARKETEVYMKKIDNEIKAGNLDAEDKNSVIMELVVEIEPTIKNVLSKKRKGKTYINFILIDANGILPGFKLNKDGLYEVSSISLDTTLTQYSK